MRAGAVPSVSPLGWCPIRAQTSRTGPIGNDREPLVVGMDDRILARFRADGATLQTLGPVACRLVVAGVLVVAQPDGTWRSL